MKKLFIVVMLGLVTSAGFAKDLKIGILDFQKIVLESKAAKEMNRKIEAQFKPRQTELLELQSSLETKSNELQRNRAVMKPSEVEQKERDILNIRRDLESKGGYFQKDLQAEQAKVSKKFSDEVQSKVDKIGKDGKFDIILQKQATVFVKEKSDSIQDITSKLIAQLK